MRRFSIWAAACLLLATVLGYLWHRLCRRPSADGPDGRSFQRPPRTNRIFTQIYDALKRHPDADGIRISIEASASDLDLGDGRVLSHVKSLCWCLIRHGEDLTKPVLATVHGGLSEETIRADLAKYFAGILHVVDNEIDIEDD